MIKNILPKGIGDLYFDASYTHQEASFRIIKSFEAFGFSRVMPAFAEFDSTMSAGKGKYSKDNSFKITDPESGEIIILRSDITIQISRIARHLLKTHELPLRLSYAGDVLRTKGEGTKGLRQLFQTGIEYIGEESGELEIITAIIEALDSLGINEVIFDFHIAGIVDDLINHLNIDEGQKGIIKAAINAKEFYKISQYELVNLFAKTGDANSTIEKILDFDIPRQIKDQLLSLKNLLSELKTSFPNLKTSIDLMDVKGFEYHKGICFSAFLISNGMEIAKGGSYEISGDSDTISASGATLYMHNLTDEISIPQHENKVYIEPGTKYTDAKNLRKEGYITINGNSFEENSSLKEEALKLGCNLILKDNKLISVDDI